MARIVGSVFTDLTNESTNISNVATGEGAAGANTEAILTGVGNDMFILLINIEDQGERIRSGNLIQIQWGSTLASDNTQPTSFTNIATTAGAEIRNFTDSAEANAAGVVSTLQNGNRTDDLIGGLLSPTTNTYSNGGRDIRFGGGDTTASARIRDARAEFAIAIDARDAINGRKYWFRIRAENDDTTDNLYTRAQFVKNLVIGDVDLFTGLITGEAISESLFEIAKQFSSESIGVSESIGSVANSYGVKSITENEAISDAGIGISISSLAESEGVAEAETQAGLSRSVITEGIGQAELETHVGLSRQVIAESEAVAESDSAVAFSILASADILGSSEITSTIGVDNAVLAESISESISESTLNISLAVESESIGLTDSVSAVAKSVSNVADVGNCVIVAFVV